MGINSLNLGRYHINSSTLLTTTASYMDNISSLHYDPTTVVSYGNIGNDDDDDSRLANPVAKIDSTKFEEKCATRGHIYIYQKDLSDDDNRTGIIGWN